jgi:uncharacterized glyoxalase superfamily protein PhnB
MKMKLELVPVPVTDVDRAIDFYVKKVGFNLDHDHRVSESLRFVQLTPEGSACSIVIGEGITKMTPGTQQGLQVVVDSAQAVYEELKKNGIEASEVETMPWGIFTSFSDPDGNTWSVQQIVK